MTWTLLDTDAPPPFGDDSWQLALLPTPAGISYYAFRLAVPVSTPLGWNIAGYWGVVQSVGGQGLLSQTHPIPIVGRGVAQTLRLIGLQDVETIAFPTANLFLCYSINKWITATGMEIWGYIP